MELLNYTFIQYAFLGGISMAILAGILGPLVVQSKQSIASDMFSHIALAGIGAAVFFESSPWWWALPTLLIASTLVWWFLQNGKYSPDALSMFFLSGGLAIALAFIHLARDASFSFESYLFGSILTINLTDLVTIGIATVIVIILVAKLWYPLLGATEQPRYLIPFKKTPEFIQLVFFWMLALAVWVGIKTIGGLLIGALLVMPTLSVRNWATSFFGVTIQSTLVAITSVIIGLFIALYIDIPPSSVIIGIMILFFVGQEIYRKIINKK